MSFGQQRSLGDMCVPVKQEIQSISKLVSQLVCVSQVFIIGRRATDKIVMHQSHSQPLLHFIELGERQGLDVEDEIVIGSLSPSCG